MIPEYQSLLDTLTKGLQTQEKRTTENLLRQYSARGFGAPTTKRVAEGLRERTARAESELGAKLGLAARKEQVGLSEAQKNREFKRQSQILSQEAAQNLLEKKFQEQRRLLEWQFNIQKEMMKEQQKRARNLGFLQTGLSMGLGALTGGLAPELFGSTFESKTLGQQLLGGALLGTSGLANLLGQQLAPPSAYDTLISQLLGNTTPTKTE